MEKLRVYYDREGNTLSVWFDDPKKEHFCEEADEDMVLVKDRDGRLMGSSDSTTSRQNSDKKGSVFPWKFTWFDVSR